MGPIIGAALGGLTSAASSIIGNQSRRREAQRQRDWQERMWNQSNEYNTPAMQMQRFREAGLNPNLIYGQGNSGNATSAGQGAMANQENINLDPLGEMGKYLMLKKTAAETNTEEKRSKLVENQANQVQSQKLLTDAQRQHERAKTANTKEQRKLIQNQATKTGLEAFYLHMGMDDNLSILGQQLENYRLEGQNLKKKGANIDADTKLKGSQSAKLDIDTKRQERQFGLYEGSGIDPNTDFKNNMYRLGAQITGKSMQWIKEHPEAAAKAITGSAAAWLSPTSVAGYSDILTFLIELFK